MCFSRDGISCGLVKAYLPMIVGPACVQNGRPIEGTQLIGLKEPLCCSGFLGSCAWQRRHDV